MCVSFCMLGNFACLFPSDIYPNGRFSLKRIFQELLYQECQTVWIHIRTNVLSGLVFVKTVYKGYQQAALASKPLNYINFTSIYWLFVCCWDIAVMQQNQLCGRVGQNKKKTLSYHVRYGIFGYKWFFLV